MKKFRVWDPITKSYGGGDLWHLSASGKLFYGNQEWPEGIVEWSIGLKDVKEVDLYVGDIVKDEYDDVSVIEFGNVGYDGDWNGLTGFALSEWKKTWQSGFTYYELEWGFSPERLERIGNIHDNPELLKGVE